MEKLDLKECKEGKSSQAYWICQIIRKINEIIDYINENDTTEALKEDDSDLEKKNKSIFDYLKERGIKYASLDTKTGICTVFPKDGWALHLDKRFLKEYNITCTFPGETWDVKKKE
ncbi:hypothetical protein CL621_01480 [archaeon]|nr:hypothetical protein [archaeon]|tara:strand:+ start:2112 stop:2459 length:348 start_codon:yes stop_codon:yes gene_type:complete